MSKVSTQKSTCLAKRNIRNTHLSLKDDVNETLSRSSKWPLDEIPRGERKNASVDIEDVVSLSFLLLDDVIPALETDPAFATVRMPRGIGERSVVEVEVEVGRSCGNRGRRGREARL
jgi:hypothetical protein